MRVRIIRSLVSGFPLSSYLWVLSTVVVGLVYMLAPGEVPRTDEPNIINVISGLIAVVSSLALIWGMVSQKVTMCRVSSVVLFLLWSSLLISAIGDQRPVATIMSAFSAVFYAYGVILAGVIQKHDGIRDLILYEIMKRDREET